MIKFSSTFRVSSVVNLILLISQFVFAAQPVATPNPDPQKRIQINYWKDPKTGITDPLTQIVRVTGGTFGGTGTLLQECRVLTALHVVLSISRGVESHELAPNESIVGQTFDYVTRPLKDGKKVMGHFTIIGHGHPQGPSKLDDVEEDWAIGYDSDCLSEKLGLGYVRMGISVDHYSLSNDSYFTAGYSYVPSAGVYSNDLYVDNNCGIIEKNANKSFNESYFESNCSLDHGGSGQPLLKIGKINGVAQFYPNGRPKLVASGMFQFGGFVDPEVHVPFTEVTTTLAPFSDSFRSKLNPFLKGPINLTPHH